MSEKRRATYRGYKDEIGKLVDEASRNRLKIKALEAQNKKLQEVVDAIKNFIYLREAAISSGYVDDAAEMEKVYRAVKEALKEMDVSSGD